MSGTQPGTRTSAKPAGADPASGSPPPLFVVGCARSGTSMLRKMLDAHPALAIPPESHFIAPMWRARKRYEVADGVDAERMVSDIVRGSRFRDWGIPADAVRRRVGALERPGFAEVIEAVFLAYAAEHGKERWGDKTPNYVLDVDLLAGLFPGARFVHLIRDGRDVVLSLLQMPWWPNKLTEAAEVWAHWTRTACEAGRALGPGRYMEIRYEALVDEPERHLRQICEFAGLQYRDEMLEYPRPSATGETPDYHRNSLGPPVKGLRDWSREMPREDLAIFEAIAGDALRELGYAPALDHVPGSVRLRASGAKMSNHIARSLREARVRAVLALKRDVLPPPRRW